MKEPSQSVTFTILINNYNYGRFLATAISSAQSQTWPHVQTIVVDDGSTDNSAEIAASYAGPNYLFLQKENGGQNSCIAHGLAHTTGDYIIILDADDWLKPQACEVLAEAVSKTRPNAAMYRLEILDLADNPTGHYPKFPYTRGNYRKQIETHGVTVTPPTSGNAYRTDFIKDAFTHIQPCTDFCDGYLSWAAAWTENIVCLDDVLGTYLLHGSNASHEGGERNRNRLYRVANHALVHHRHLYRWLKARDSEPADWKDLIQAYVWQQILLLKLEDHKFSDFSYSDCRKFGVPKFLAARHHGWRKQIKNIAFLIMGSILGPMLDMARRQHD
jgi:glycosyltransferase involved in cell wall biosynthesis